MAFNGTEGEEITLDEGAAMTAAYRLANPDRIIAGFYGRDILEELLAVPGAKGIRIYYGLDSDGNNETVLVAADADGNDILSLVVDRNKPCPKWCSSANPLNSGTNP